MDELLRVEDLHTHFVSKHLTIRAVNGANLTVGRENVVALVGESGAGKTTVALSVMGILPSGGKVVQGRVFFKGVNLLDLPAEERRKVRGKEIALIVQHPRAALSPINTIRKQIEEGILAHEALPPKELRERSEQLLREMDLPDPRRVLDSYPFQLSGGMAQRVVIAIAMALRPKVLIADEPTSDLDLTIQAQILSRLKQLTREHATSILLITHNLGIVAHMANYVVVMYAGWTAEQGPVKAIFDRPRFPYTWSLVQTFSGIYGSARRLMQLKEVPVDPIAPQVHCPFLPRCPKAINTCRLEAKPPLVEIEPQHWVACYNPIVYD